LSYTTNKTKKNRKKFHIKSLKIKTVQEEEVNQPVGDDWRVMSSPSPSSLDSVGTSPLGSFSDPNEHPLLARDLGLGPLVGYGDSGVFNGINGSTFSSSMLHNSALSLYLNGIGSSNIETNSTLKVSRFRR